MKTAGEPEDQPPAGTGHVDGERDGANTGPPYTLFSTNERRYIVALVTLAAWFSTLSSFTYFPAISTVARDLDSPVTLINLTVTSYLVVSGITPSIVGDAADTFGRRPLYLITLTLYLVANVGIALQRSFAAMLVLRMLQSAGISGMLPSCTTARARKLTLNQGTYSVAYGVIADIAAPSERGAFVGAVSITTAPSVGPVIGGALASGPGWRWIFWFLAIMSAFCLTAMVFALPETNRASVGNGSTPPPTYSQPLISGIMEPWKRHRARGPSLKPPKRRIPNPIHSLRVLRRKDTAANIVAGSILYTIFSCMHTSLSTTFGDVYNLNQLQAGLVYLPYGIGAIASTVTSGKWIDRDYRVTAERHGLSINKVSGDDLLEFPIEEARIRSVFIPTVLSLVGVVAYGWLVEKRAHIAAPLVFLFLVGWSIQTCFNVTNTILVDINQDSPATAQASFNLARCLVSGLFVAILQEMINKMGFGWTYTFLGALCLISLCMYFAELRWGWAWRRARHDSTI